MYQYNFNNSTLRYNYWKCSVKSCGARITTIKDTNDMVGENLPHHEHGILRLKRKVQETERERAQGQDQGSRPEVPRIAGKRVLVNTCVRAGHKILNLLTTKY